MAEAIAFIFSNKLICDDAASAQAVTFAYEVGMCCIMLDSDVYDPSGGAALSRLSVLVCTQELRAVKERVTAVWRTLTELEREEVVLCAARDKWSEHNTNLRLRRSCNYSMSHVSTHTNCLICNYNTL